MENKYGKFSCGSIPEIEQEVGYSAFIQEIQKNQDYLLEKKIFLPYGVGPVIDCEVDEDSDEPDYSKYVLKKQKNKDCGKKKGFK